MAQNLIRRGEATSDAGVAPDCVSIEGVKKLAKTVRSIRFTAVWRSGTGARRSTTRRTRIVAPFAFVLFILAEWTVGEGAPAQSILPSSEMLRPASIELAQDPRYVAALSDLVTLRDVEADHFAAENKEGQDGHEEELKRIIDEKGLTRDVIFLGPAFGDAKKACFQNADAFVLPSFSEGLPMSILEAWSYSLPVVKTRECNIPEGFEAGAAVEVSPDVDSVVNGLKSLFSLSAAERKNMGLRGRNLVEAKFSWPQIAGQMIEVYKWVLGQGSQPNCVKLD